VKSKVVERPATVVDHVVESGRVDWPLPDVCDSWPMTVGVGEGRTCTAVVLVA
jgi:hypothetical protein